MQLGIFFFSLFLLSGCGSNNSQSYPSTAPDAGVSGGGSTEIATLNIMNNSAGTVSVSQDGQSVSISILARDKNSIAVDGAAVLVQYPETPLGSFSSKTVDVSAGLASFAYKAPNNLKALIDSGTTQEQFTFYAYDAENKQADTTVKAVLTVKFDLTAAPDEDDTIANISLTPQNFEVNGLGQSQVVTVNAYTKNGLLVNAPITLSITDTTGVFTNASGTTNPASSVHLVGGVGTFTYTAPTDEFPDVDDKFTIKDGFNGVSNTITVKFGPHTNVPNITVDTAPATLTSDGEGISVVVKAIDAQGVPLKTGSIEVLYPAGSFIGTFAQSKVQISNGVANFSFTGPTPLLTSSDKIFTFRFVENKSRTATWRVSYSPDVPTSVQQITTLSVDNNVTFNISGESKTVKVSAFYAGNIPALSGKVRVSYPEASGSIGSFSPLVADVTNGVAVFTFTAPTPLVTAPDKIFTFSVVDGGSATTQLGASYSPIVQGAVKPKTILVFENNKITTDTNITKNGEIKTFQIQVWGEDDQPFEGGNVKIKFPITEINNGVDVGFFGETTVACVNGQAEFTYNAPSNLGNRNDSFTFNFYHDSTDSLAGEKPLTMHMDPDPGQIVITTYELVLTSSDGNSTMGLEAIKAFTARVVDEDGNEIAAGDGNFTITNLNPILADIVDTDGSLSDTLIKNNEQNINFRIQTEKKSGLIPLKIAVDFTDINGNAQTIEKVFNIVVFSGPPTSISISYASTGQEAADAKFVEHMVVTVTDKYLNPVNTQPAISVGTIIGYVGGSDPANYAYKEPDSSETGTIDPVAKTFITSTGRDFSAAYPNGMDYDNDILVTFGKDYTYNASGKWDITEGTPTTQLNLEDDIDGTSSVTNLGFALGNNQRDLTCQPGSEAVGFTQVEDGAYQLSTDGIAHISMNYDYYLVGKEVIFWINLIGYQADQGEIVRVGEAHKHTLRGHGLIPVPSSISISKDTTVTKNVKFLITDTTVWYRNAYAGANVDVQNIESYSIAHTNPSDCDNSSLPIGGGADTDGITYWQITATAKDDADGSISISDALVGGEGL
jgi:hypothetical protein